MRKVPNLNFFKVIKALQRAGWIVVRQKGSHIRLHNICNFIVCGEASKMKVYDE